MAKKLNIDWSNLAADYERLGSIRAVAREYGCCKSVAWNRLVQREVPVKPIGGQPQSKSYQKAVPPQYWPTARRFIQLMAIAKSHSQITGERGNIDMWKLRQAIQSAR